MMHTARLTIIGSTIQPAESSVPRLRMSPEPSTSELVSLGAQIKLRDGSRIRIRQGHRSDRELLLRGFERLSPESRYRRFLAPISQLSDEMVRYLTEIDHHDHEAMIAVDERTGEGIGVARYVRDRKRRDMAEVAVTVIDEWQGRGVGTVLLEVICGRAREEEITTFTALILATNQEMLDVFRGVGPVRIVDQGTGTVEIEMPIPTIGVPPALKKLVQVSARREVIVSIDNRYLPD
jgi:GNAT superfamily N-acetyltransferase